MGVEYRGVLCVGYTFTELEELMDEYPIDVDSIYEWCEQNDIQSYSPYYDADVDHCIYGHEVAGSDDYNYAEVQPGLDEKILSVQSKLMKQFGKASKAYIMANGW